MQYFDQLLLPIKAMKKDQACTTLSSFCRRIVFHKLSSFHCFTCCTTITDQPRVPLFLHAQVVFRLNIQEDMNASVEAQILRHLPTLLPAVLFAVGKSTPFISIAESFDSTQRSKRLKAVRRLQQAFVWGRCGLKMSPLPSVTCGANPKPIPNELPNTTNKLAGREPSLRLGACVQWCAVPLSGCTWG